MYYVYAATNINLKELSVLHYDGGLRVNRSEMIQHFNLSNCFLQNRCIAVACANGCI